MHASSSYVCIIICIIISCITITYMHHHHIYASSSHVCIIITCMHHNHSMHHNHMYAPSSHVCILYPTTGSQRHKGRPSSYHHTTMSRYRTNLVRPRQGEAPPLHTVRAGQTYARPTTIVVRDCSVAVKGPRTSRTSCLRQ